MPQTSVDAPLTEQVETLVDLACAGRADDFRDLCGMLGVTNGPALWAGTRARLGMPA
ncbi:MAG: hypothetical protein HYU51_15965 [Candidatus Rokubacteria bacterium]|nr:hypothetical protein [Candidatus Rokubacteria bacterium]